MRRPLHEAGEKVLSKRALHNEREVQMARGLKAPFLWRLPRRFQAPGGRFYLLIRSSEDSRAQEAFRAILSGRSKGGPSAALSPTRKQAAPGRDWMFQRTKSPCVEAL